MLTAVDEFHDIKLEVVPDVLDHADQPLKPVIAPIDVRVHDVSRQVELDLGVKKLRHARELPLIHRFVATADNLQVLLRHRPRSISRAG